MNDTINDETINNEKKISISGTNNRYQIKKLVNNKSEPKKRKTTLKWTISEEWLSDENQKIMITELYNSKILKTQENTNVDIDTVNRTEIIIAELNKKIASYKQQDLLRKLFDPEKFIDLNTIIQNLYECNLNCYYCKEKMAILYEIVREMKQWTVDRIDNDTGHNNDNIIMACLDCNLNRRRKNKDAFLFTKQLNIVKSEENNSV